MDKINILIVEDEAMIAKEIERMLLRLDYGVTDIVSSYDDALSSIKNNRPDVMLIDISLKGGKDGIDLALVIQKRGTIPFIYLTAEKNEKIMIRAAQTSPSAYLNKPFRREELHSNLLIICNKIKAQNRLQAIGEHYIYDRITSNLFYKSIPIHMGTKEKSLLKLLIEADGAIVAFSLAREHIWGTDIPISENALRNIIYKLRRKLKYLEIETIPSFGYRLNIA